MDKINQIKSQLQDKGIHPNSILVLSIEKLINDLYQEIKELKMENERLK